MMTKPCTKERYLKDWGTKLTDEWIEYAQKAQTSHCRNINANERGVRYKEDLIHKIDELVLMHAFGASTKKGPPHSDIRMNFSAAQRQAAGKVRKMIVKYGKNKNSGDTMSSVSIQVISVTLMLVEYPEGSNKGEKAEEKNCNDETQEKTIKGAAQIAIFRVVQPDGNFCFIDHTGRYYSNWKDYLDNNKLPRCKMCYPRNGIYTYKKDSSKSIDENNNERRYILDLVLSDSVSCTNWERFKAGSMKVVSYVGLTAGAVAIIAAPFTGGASAAGYVTFASAIAGWVSFGCTIIGAVANLTSIWDKFWHDESFNMELASLLMTALHFGVAKYNANLLAKVKAGAPITQTQLIFMTVLNCVRFGVDSIMFVVTLVRLVKKACTEGLRSITALELIQFSMSAIFFGKSLFAPKTGYGIIKEAQRRYLMEEKRANIKDEGALKKYDELVNPEERFGDGSIKNTVQNDWDGLSCSKDQCDKLNSNAGIISNINAFEDLNQFFLEVSDTNSTLSMTKDGKILVNEQFETDGKTLNDFGETRDGNNVQRRALLQGTSIMRKEQEHQETLFENSKSMTDSEYMKESESSRQRYLQGEDMTKNSFASSQSKSNVTNEPIQSSSSTSSEQCPTEPQVDKDKSLKTMASQNSITLQQLFDMTDCNTTTAYAHPIQEKVNWISDTATQLNAHLMAINQQGVQQSIRLKRSYCNSSDDDCLCQPIIIRVLYVNIRSINPNNPSLKDKIAKLKNLISDYQPQLIAIVETWLTKEHNTEHVLRLLGIQQHTYKCFRHDRADGHDPNNAYGNTITGQEDRRGGGTLVLWKRDAHPNTRFEPYGDENYADNVINFQIKYTFNCGKCSNGKKFKKFIFTVVYRRPSPFKDEDRSEFDRKNQEVIDRLAHLCRSYDDDLLGFSGIVLVGDFNLDDRMRKGVKSLEHMISGSYCTPMNLSADRTHRNGTALDQVISSPGFVSGFEDVTEYDVEVTDFVSDHAALVFDLYLGEDSEQNNPCQAKRCA